MSVAVLAEQCCAEMGMRVMRTMPNAVEPILLDNAEMPVCRNQTDDRGKGYADERRPLVGVLPIAASHYGRCGVSGVVEAK